MDGVVLAGHLSSRVEAAIKQARAEHALLSAAACCHTTRRPGVLGERAQVLGGEGDEFDAPEFDAVEYINRAFGDEASLAGLDRRIGVLTRDIRGLDDSILGAAQRRWACANRAT